MPPPRDDAPFAIASKPDRSLSMLGSYVRLRKTYRKNGSVVGVKGQVGIVVADTRGVCKKGEIAVYLPGMKRDYKSVPVKHLEVLSRP